MDLRIVTAILILLSLYLHTSAADELEKKHSKIMKHSGALKKRRNFHKALVGTKIGEKNSEKLTKTEKHKPPLAVRRKMNVPKNKNKKIVEKTINSQEITRKNEIKIVKSAESRSQIEDPLVDSVKSDEYRKSADPVLTNMKDTVDVPAQIIKEIIIVKSDCDMRKLLDNIGLNGDRLSKKEDGDLLRINIPEESRKSIIKFQNQLENDEENKELQHEEKIESRNMNQNEIKEKKVSGEEIAGKYVIDKENRKAGRQHKNLGGEIKEEYLYVKPSTLKRYMYLENEEPYSSEEIEVKNFNGNQEIEKLKASHRIENKIASQRKNTEVLEEDEEEEVVPNEDVQKINISKSTKKRKQMKNKNINKNIISSQRKNTEAIEEGADEAEIPTEDTQIINNVSQSNKKSKQIKNNFINKKNISSKRKKIEEVEGEAEELVVPAEDISKPNKKIEEIIVKETLNPSDRKQLEVDLIKEDLNKYDSSKGSIEVEEHIYSKNMNSEPESIEKYIYIENNKYPSARKYIVEEDIITEGSGGKGESNDDLLERKYSNTDRMYYSQWLRSLDRLGKENRRNDDEKIKYKYVDKMNGGIAARNFGSGDTSDDMSDTISNKSVGEDLVAEESGRKYGVYTYPDENENKIVKKKKNPSLRRLKASEEISEKIYDNSKKRKSEKEC